MNAEEPLPDESILPQLRACDEALAAGDAPQEPTDPNTPGELRSRLEGDLAFIQVLRKVLPRRSTGATPGFPEAHSAQFAADDLPFQELGRFQIRRRLGLGSFGMVFLAFDPQLGREVALKVPRPESLLTSEFRERFLREARAAAGLDHPHLVPVYESGAVGPLCYIASAYCPGITLSQWLKEITELSPERLAAAIVAKLADAVGHAHTRGVVHRDLKPSNVLLQSRHRDPADGNSTLKHPVNAPSDADREMEFIPRITDFGLAKLIGDATALHEDGGGLETRSGAVLGTPNYMAPEQASGKNKEIGPSADVYALGGILYELLTGRPPFRGESLLETLEQVRTQEPLPPSRLRPKLSRDLETICLKCLQKEPEKRYETATALAEDLNRYLAGEPIQARPVPAWERGIKWARRRPAWAALWVVSIVSPLVIAGISLAYNAQLRERGNQLQEAYDAEKQERRRAEERELDARNFSYVSDMNLAQHEWTWARLKSLKELLQRQRPPAGAADLRGFEWYYWQRLLEHSALRTLSEYGGKDACVACSPDGRLIASGGRDGKVRVWDTATWRERGEPVKLRLPVTALAFAEGGRSLIVASGPKVHRLSVSDRNRRQTLIEGKSQIRHVAIADRLRVLAVLSRQGVVEVWDMENKVLRHTLSRQKVLLMALAFSPDNKTLAAADNAGKVHLWEAPAFQVQKSINAHQKGINGLAFAPDGKALATAGEDATIRLWDLEAGKERAILAGHTNQVLSVQFSPDGKILVSASVDETVRVWDAATGTQLFSLKGHSDIVRAASFTPDGRTIVSAGADGAVKLWDARRSPEHFSWNCHDQSVYRLAYTPDGRILASGGEDGLVKLWDTTTNRELVTLPPFQKQIQGLTFAPDGNNLAVVCSDLFVHIYDRQRAKLVARLEGHSDVVLAVAFSPDGALLASAGRGGRVRVWDWQSQKQLANCDDPTPIEKGKHKSILGLAFSPDGKLLASGGFDFAVKLWDPSTGRLLERLDGHKNTVNAVAFAPDGRTLASGGGDQMVYLWDVESKTLQKSLPGHSGSVLSLAFSPDSRTLASTSGEVKLWQRATGGELASFILPGTVFPIAWAPDGKQLAAGGRHADGRRGFITVWNAGTRTE